MKVIKLKSQFESYARGLNVKRDMFSEGCRIDLDDDNFEQWLHTQGVKTSRQIENWVTQKVLMSGNIVIGLYWDSELEYKTEKNLNYF